MNQFKLIYFFLFFSIISKGQVNYVYNGGFEELDSCDYYFYIGDPTRAVGWDTLRAGGGGTPDIYNACTNYNIFFNYTGVPKNQFGYQPAKSGLGYAGIAAFYTPTNIGYCEYIQGSLIGELEAKKYCVKFYVNLGNNTNCAITKLGVCFDNANGYSIPYQLISNATPQIVSSNTLVLKDTVKWVKIQNVFGANGGEKYITIGNFNSAQNTFSFMTQVATGGIYGAYYYLDDISVIATDLPANAGPDQFYVPGDSIFIGRPPEIGLDEDCSWYKLPNDSVAIDTIAGLWVKPVGTCTYIVKQDICGTLSQDTVVAYQSALRIAEQEAIKNNITLFPNPATDILNISFNLNEIDFNKIKIENSLGNLIREEEITTKNKKAIIKTNDLSNGVYVLKLLMSSNSNNSLIISKRFVISR